MIEELNTSISSAVMEYVKENESIDVRGLSYDKDGVVTGFDYSEFFYIVFPIQLSGFIP